MLHPLLLMIFGSKNILQSQQVDIPSALIEEIRFNSKGNSLASNQIRPTSKLHKKEVKFASRIPGSASDHNRFISKRNRSPRNETRFATRVINGIASNQRRLLCTKPGTAGRIVPIPEKPRNSPRPGWVAEVRPPSPPSPSKDYEEKAGLDPVPQDAPARLLVILDLNGTLLFRPNKTNPRRIIVRPGVPAFLDYLFRNHVVMVYSSARPENCAAMLDQIFRPDQKTVVAAVWARDKLGLTTAQYNVKVQVYKKLEPVWRDKNIQKRAGPSRVWDQTNTVLVDDTKLKALAQPHNLLQIPEFMSKEPKTIQARLDWWRNEELMVQSVQQKLEELKFQTDVSRLIRQWQTGARPAPGVVDETVDQKALQNLDGREASLTPAPSVSDRQVSVNPQQLDTPCASPLPNDQKDLPQYKPVGVEDDGVSSGDEGGMTLDDLEQDINRNLSISQNPAKQKLSQPRQTAGAASAAGYAATTDETQRRSESLAFQDVQTDPSRTIGDGSQSEPGIQSVAEEIPSCEEERPEGTNRKRADQKHPEPCSAGQTGTEGCEVGTLPRNQRRTAAPLVMMPSTMKEEISPGLKGAPMTPESLGP